MEHMHEVHHKRSWRMQRSPELLQGEKDPMLLSSRQKSDILPSSKTSLLGKASQLAVEEFPSEHKESLTGQSEVITTFTSLKVCNL